MKYEYLCGYESDFFAMPENVIAVVRLDHCVQGITEFNQIIECGKPVLAMRRIIADPKRWTVEDQKAGRLPDVGSEVILRTTGEIATINAANKNMVCLTFSDGGFSPFNVERIDPIESPEEKSQREEDEFISSLRNVEIHGRTVGGFFNQGARAAYRKLKGGE